MSGGGLTQEERDAALAEAEAKSFTVVKADDFTLLLDLDTPEAIAQYRRVIDVVGQYFFILGAEEWRSKSGNLHVRIGLDAPQPWAIRYALECALGSDGVRGALGVMRKLKGCDEGSVLFRPPHSA